VIEDLEGATSEPSRRTHVAVLSAFVAAASLVLLFVLVAPPTLVGAPPHAASPSPTPSFAMTVLSNPLINLPLDPRSSMCAASTTWTPLQLAVDATRGRALLVVYDRTGSRPIAFFQEERGTGRLVVTCLTADSFAPRINRAR
jgi:hypothetical protein